MASYKLVDAEQLDADLATVADAIRAKTGGTELLSFPDGMAAEVGAVYEAGRQAEYDAFWDVFQDYGNRSNNTNAFSGPGWKDENFFPKYDIKLSGSSGAIFQYSSITNLKDKLIQQGVKLDTSNCTWMLQMFQGAAILHIPELNISKAENTSYAFGSSAAVHTIDKLIVSENTVLSTSTFQTASKLVNVTFEGTIAAVVDLHWSPLSKASIVSTIGVLSDTAADLTASFSLAAVNTAFETSEGAADGSTSEEWLALVETKSNWTISLV